MISKWNQWIDYCRQNRFTPIIVTILFVIVAALTVWQLIDRLHIKKIKKDTPLLKIEAPAASIANLHLLGNFEARTADIPITQLQLTLQGTVVVMNDSTRSQALIFSPGQPTKVYKEGDFLPGNAKVQKIEQHVVIINDNGQLQKLRMPINTLANIKLPKD